MTKEVRLVTTKEDYLSLVDVLEMFGDLIIKIGNFEKKVGKITKFQDIFEEKMDDIVTELENNPELSVKIGTIMVKFLTLTNYLKRDFDETPPEDKIKAGTIMKEIAILLKDTAEKHEE